MLVRHDLDHGLVFDTLSGKVMGLYDEDSIFPYPNFVDEFGYGWDDQELTRPHKVAISTTSCSLDEFQKMSPDEFSFEY